VKTRLCFFLALTGSLLAAEPAEDPVVLAVQKALPSVVNVSTEQFVERLGRDPFEDLYRQFFGQPRGVRSTVRQRTTRRLHHATNRQRDAESALMLL